MKKNNKVFIATSLDGFIADKNGGIDWLDTFPEINNIDTGYAEFTSNIDAIVMGRSTFEKVCSFGIEWPYKKPVFVVSNSIGEISEELKSNPIFLVKGNISEILSQIHQKGHYQLYIDGGMLIQSFLKEDLIDEIVITIIPVLLGEGIPLFSKLPKPLKFECKKSILFLDKIVQNHFKRKQ